MYKILVEPLVIDNLYARYVVSSVTLQEEHKKQRAEIIKNRTTVEKSLTFHLVLHPSLSSNAGPGRRSDLPSASLVSWPRLGPRFHLVHLGDCTLSPHVT